MSDTLTTLLEAQFKVKARGKLSTVQIGDTLPATLIVSNNPNRVGLVISNPSNAQMYVSFEAAMGLTDGVTIVPNGGTLSMIWSEDFDQIGWAWYAVASIDDSKLNILESILR